jgi:uncharacterized cupredoxin-like copper-binding protein
VRPAVRSFERNRRIEVNIRNSRSIMCLPLLALCFTMGCCSDDDSGSESNASTTTIDVKIGEFYVHATPASTPAGTVKFHITNEGPEDVHELVVLKTDIAPADLPLNADGDADEEADGVTAMGEVEDLAVDASEDLELDLAAGKYVLICNIAQAEPDAGMEHHYPLGMYAGFTVE